MRLHCRFSAHYDCPFSGQIRMYHDKSQALLERIWAVRKSGPVVLAHGQIEFCIQQSLNSKQPSADLLELWLNGEFQKKNSKQGS